MNESDQAEFTQFLGLDAQKLAEALVKEAMDEKKSWCWTEMEKRAVFIIDQLKPERQPQPYAIVRGVEYVIEPVSEENDTERFYRTEDGTIIGTEVVEF